METTIAEPKSSAAASACSPHIDDETPDLPERTAVADGPLRCPFAVSATATQVWLAAFHTFLKIRFIFDLNCPNC